MTYLISYQNKLLTDPVLGNFYWTQNGPLSKDVIEYEIKQAIADKLQIQHSSHIVITFIFPLLHT